ncbi:MAG TPA: FAD-dependent oxidoreductase, partial [Planctomycetota bacterium]|nr:FAD-dependent oxidoreductase [Planctomycetota bacterium]
MAKIAILGAGVSGLSLARYLVQGGVSPSDLVLFEAGSVAGGLCRSKTVDGFTYDVAGGHILFSKDQAAMDWMKDEAGGPAAFDQRDRNTKIRFGDRWVHYPFENGIGDLPKQANFDCLAGYVKAWHQRITDGSDAPQTFGKWVTWRFGDGIAKHFMDPYNAKIWKRDLDFLTSDWVAGRVPDAPIEDVLRAAVGIRTEGYTHQAIFYYPKQGGFQGITDGMAASLGSSVRLNTPVQEVRKHGNGVRVNGEEFDLCVSTLTLTHTPKLFPEMPAQVAEAMRTLEYNGLVSILVALDRPEHPDLSWIYLPHDSQGPANRVTYMSNYATLNAPPGKTSLMAEVTVRGGQPMPGKELEEEVLAGFVAAGLMGREEVLFTDRSTVDHAYVVFDALYHQRRKVALGWLESIGVIPLGRFGRFEYDNSDQCVIKSRALSQQLLAV